MPQLPDHIQVGPMRYSVKIDQAAINEDGHEAFGRTKHRTQRILIAEGQAPDQEADTVLHETLHALCAVSGVMGMLSNDLEEGVVDALAPLLLDTLRRNPDLVAYLLGVTT